MKKEELERINLIYNTKESLIKQRNRLNNMINGSGMGSFERIGFRDFDGNWADLELSEDEIRVLAKRALKLIEDKIYDLERKFSNL